MAMLPLPRVLSLSSMLERPLISHLGHLSTLKALFVSGTPHVEQVLAPPVIRLDLFGLLLLIIPLLVAVIRTTPMIQITTVMPAVVLVWLSGPRLTKLLLQSTMHTLKMHTVFLLIPTKSVVSNTVSWCLTARRLLRLVLRSPTSIPQTSLHLTSPLL